MKRQHMMILLIGVSICLLITGFNLIKAPISGTSYAAGAQVIGPVVGLKAPDFTLPDLSGAKIKLSGFIKNNKVTVLNFWATWCPPCRKEIPDLIKFYSKYKTQKVGLLGVDLQEKLSDTKTFVQKNKMNYPVLTDTEAVAAQLYSIYVIPTTYLIDRKGKVRDMIQGGIDLTALEAKVKELLKEK